MAKKSNSKNSKPFRKDEKDMEFKKGDRRNTRERGARNKRAVRDDKEPIINDPRWWMNTGQLAIDACRISTFNAIGAPHVSPTYTRNKYTPTGILRLDYIPYFGTFSSPTHPINVAAKRSYDVINSKNSRNPSYDPSDLMIYFIAVGQAWSLYEFGKRIIGIYNTFSPVNRYWWRPFIKSMGIDDISVANDIVSWRNAINRLANKLNMLAVPKDIPYFDRAGFMNRGVYTDSPSAKASLYYFCPAAVMAYKAPYGQGSDFYEPSQLINKTTPWFGSNVMVNAAEFESFCNSIVDPLFNDTDIASMGADIIKAFGIENTYQLPSVTETEQLFPAYSAEINMQVHNARMAYSADPDLNVNNKYTIHQDMINNCLVATQEYTTEANRPDRALVATDLQGNKGIALDFPIDNVNEADVMEATRLTWFAEKGPGLPGPDGEVDIKFHACTELLVRDRLFYFSETTNEWTVHSIKDSFIIGFGDQMTSSGFMSDVAPRIAYGSKISCAPITYLVVSRTGESGSDDYGSPKYMEIISDLTNYTTIDAQDLRNMHDAAHLSIFTPVSLMKRM